MISNQLAILASGANWMPMSSKWCCTTQN